MSNFPLDFTPQCHHLRWLCEHLGGWQFGEQELLLAVADAIDIAGQVVEIGAGDGDKLPLTTDLLYKKGNSCVFFEINPISRTKLAAKYTNASIQCEYREQALPCASLVVIDIDGDDSVVMQQVMERDKPIVVVCEHMDRHYPAGTASPYPIPQWLLGTLLPSGHAIQDTAETLQAMASKLGYERFGYNRCNSFFVRKERFTDLFR